MDISIMDALQNTTRLIRNWTDSKLKTGLEVKVDKVDGKKLSSNDYTTPDKLRVQNMATQLILDDGKLSLGNDNGETVSNWVSLPSGGGGGGGSYPGGGSSAVSLTLKGSSNITAAQGQPANIAFNFYSTDAPGLDGTLSIYVGSDDKPKGQEKIRSGDNSIDISKYLDSGYNEVKVKAKDFYSNTSRELNYTIYVVELKVESNFNASQVFKATVNNDAINYEYIVSGAVAKTMHFVLDGVDTTVNIGESIGEKEQPIRIKSHGVHKLEVYASADLDGDGKDEIESSKLTYDLVYAIPGHTDPIISSVYTTTLIKQGELVNIPFFIFDPNNSTVDVELTIKQGDKVYSQQIRTGVGQVPSSWSTRNYPTGEKVTFIIALVGNSDCYKAHTISVQPSEVKVEVKQDFREFQLLSDGKSNSASDRDNWTDGSVTTTLEDFNWTSTGWIEDNEGDIALRLSGKSKATINFQPFDGDPLSTGKTIEIKFAIRDVNDRNAVAISCTDGSIGFSVKADAATLSTDKTSIACQYTDEEKIHLTFVATKRENYHLLYIYLNGVLSSVKQYGTKDVLTQNPVQSITIGSESCCVDLYMIRSYRTALNKDDVKNNYIASIENTSEKISVYADNDIYDKEGKLAFSQLKDKIPVLVITGDLPQSKGDEKIVDISYTDPFNPQFNYSESGVEIDVQGTSSQFYIRKNYKIKTNEEHQFAISEMPGKVFTFKADYAEATSTHNTGNANYVHTLYGDIKTPPQLKDDRVRTTIYGHPCVIFHRTNSSDSNLVFLGKYNYNWDKGANNVYGFTAEYDPNGTVQSWEVKNNTDPQCNFLATIPANWQDHLFWNDKTQEWEPKYFEPRYPKKCEDVTSLKRMHDWVVSTKNNVTKFKNEFAQYFDLDFCLIYYVYSFVMLMADQRAKNMFLTTWDGKIWAPWFYDNDTCLGINNEGQLVFDYYHEDHDSLQKEQVDKLARSYAVLSRGVNVHTNENLTLETEEYAEYLQVCTEIATIFPELAVGNDIYGSVILTLEGKVELLLDAYENAELDGDVYNGADSVLWTNFREAFKIEIQQCYQNLRNNNKLTYSKIIEYFITNQSDKWSISIYNEDSDYKYISMARDPVNPDAGNLNQVRGTGEEHLRYFVQNRIMYCDSKWSASDYEDDYIAFRVYTPGAGMAVTPNANITITPYSNMYAGVKFKANGERVTHRLVAGVPYVFKPPVGESFDSTLDENESEEFNDTEAAIYGASELSSLGDLSALYLGYLDVHRATKLTELIIGSGVSGYRNTFFGGAKGLSVGANKLLRKVDVRGCVNFKDSLNLSLCPNIQEVYAANSGITGVDLPESGYLRVLQLPSTIAGLTIKNQQYLEDFDCAGYGNLLTLHIENTVNIPVEHIVKNATKLKTIRLVGVTWQASSETELSTVIQKFKTCNGINDSGGVNPTAVIRGRVKVPSISDDLFADIYNNFKDLIVEETGVGPNPVTKCVVRYLKYDGTAFYTDVLRAGDAIPTPNVSAEQLYRPVDAEDEGKMRYVFTRWEGLTNNIQTHVDVRPVYKKQYSVNYYKDADIVPSNYICAQWLDEGGNATNPIGSTIEGVVISTPTKAGNENIKYEFASWSALPQNVTSSQDVHALYDSYYPVRFYKDGRVIASELHDTVWTKSGSTATLPSNPTKASTAQYDYKFKQWAGDYTNVTGPRDITAKYDSITRKYTVYFCNGDQVPPKVVNVSYGSTATYSGAPPIKQVSASDMYTSSDYEWTGKWDPEPIPTEKTLKTVSGETAVWCYPVFKFIATLGDTWDDIAYNVEHLTDADLFTRYPIGARKNLEFTIDGNTYNTIVEVIAHNHDNRVDDQGNSLGKAKLTFFTYDLPMVKESEDLSLQRPLITTRTVGWGGSQLRQYMNNDLFNGLPGSGAADGNLQSAIKQVSKAYNVIHATNTTSSIKYSNDKCWAASDKELALYKWDSNGNITEAYYPKAHTYGQGEVYSDTFSFEDLASRQKNFFEKNTGAGWWTRSLYIPGEGNTSNMAWYVWANGKAGGWGSIDSALTKYAVAFGFCI